MDTLFYDGQCPLCAKEIRLLRRLADDGLQFSDIHRLSEPHEPGREQLLKTLHLKTDDGGWATGLRATVTAWRHTRLGWLFAPLLWPGLEFVASRVYRRWADRRFDKRYCSNGQCQLPPTQFD